MPVKQTSAGGGDGITGVIQATNQLANDVGPAWGLAIVVAIMLFFPKWGVVVHLAQLFKEDRQDARKRKLETERLNAKLNNRPPPKQLPHKGSSPRHDSKK